MISAWRRSGGEDRYAAPVEMRFIDMFMAALGALVFMAMLLAFLLKYLPPEERGPGKDPEVPTPTPFEIVSTSMPRALADSVYEFAFAYRGGTGGVMWEVAAGKGEIPNGMTFDHSKGVLAGRPATDGSASFVVRARDVTGNTDERPFTLMVASPSGGRDVRRWLALALDGLIAAIWARVLRRVFVLKRILGVLRRKWSSGETVVHYSDGRGVTTQIELPGGLRVYEEQLRQRRREHWFLLTVLLIASGFLAWMIWW